MATVDLKDRNKYQDFLSFCLDGKNSLEYKIYRTTVESGVKDTLTPEIKDTADEVLGQPGATLVNSEHKEKRINISFVIDGVTERELQMIKKWLTAKGEKELWFAETPYKVYTVRLASTPKITVSPNLNKSHRRIYYGTGEVQFITNEPQAQTPNKILVQSQGENDVILDGTYYTSYALSNNYAEIADCLPRQKDSNGKARSLAFGQLPFYFKATLMSPFKKGLESILVSNINGEQITTKSKPLSGEDTDMATRTYTIQHSPDESGNYTKTITLTINVDEDIYTDYQWDSKTGLVTAAYKNNPQRRVVIPHEGESIARIDPGPFEATGMVTIDHNYWYY